MKRIENKLLLIVLLLLGCILFVACDKLPKIVLTPSDKEEYIREQSIYFQNIFYENDTSMFFDGWNTKKDQFHGGISILKDYLNFILFHLTSKIDIFLIPINHEKNEIASKSLCYYFLMKQMMYINVTSNEQKNDINNDLMNHIYNEIFNKDK